jgi:hypothetical protein
MKKSLQDPSAERSVRVSRTFKQSFGVQSNISKKIKIEVTRQADLNASTTSASKLDTTFRYGIKRRKTARKQH